VIENFRLLISFVLTALLLGSQPSFFILGTSLSFFRVHVLIDFLPLSTMLIVFGIAGLAMVQADALTCWSPFQAINSTEPHDTGQFLEMLVASTERPAMLAFKELVARSERYRAHDRCMFFFLLLFVRISAGRRTLISMGHIPTSPPPCPEIFQ